MENFLKTLFRKGQQGVSAATGSVVDLFTQQEDEQDRKATVAEKTGQKVADFFAPQPIEKGIRVRDVIRETPENFASAVGRPILRSFAALGQKIGTADIRGEYVAETPFEKSMFGEAPVSFTSIGKETRMANPEDKTIPFLDPVLGGIIAASDAPTGGRASQTVKGGIKAFEGATNYTTKVLDALKGKTSVSRQFIEDLLRKPDIKEAERTLVNKVLRETPEGKVDVARFAEAVEDEVLPLSTPSNTDAMNSKEAILQRINRAGYEFEEDMDGGGYLLRDGEPTDYDELPDAIRNDLDTLAGGADNYQDAMRPFTSRYESINLPEEQRGPVAIYREKIYESPIKTSAGGTHFGSATQNYFGHTRIEDLPAKGMDFKIGPAEGVRGLAVMARDPYDNGGLRIVAQGFETEADAQKYIDALPEGGTRRVLELQSDLFQKGRLDNEIFGGAFRGSGYAKLLPSDEFDEYIALTDARRLPTQADRTRIDELRDKALAMREAEVAKLEPYKNTWWERMVREEVKDAAAAGKTRLLFPTGETAMKVEGLGGNSSMWFDAGRQAEVNRAVDAGETPNITSTLEPEDLEAGKVVLQGSRTNGTEWVVLDDSMAATGQFTALPVGILTRYDLVPEDLSDKVFMKILGEESDLLTYAEEFNIGEGLDKENPIYKFYDREIAKYLKNKYGATRFTDENGVTWVQVDVKPQMAKAPVEAFGVAAGVQTDEEGNVEFDPLSALLGMGAIGATRAIKGSGNGKPGKMTPKILKAIQDFFKTSELKNGSPVKAITESADSFRVTFENGKNPVLLNKAWASQNLGITSKDQLEEIYKTTKTFKTVGDILKKGGTPPETPGTTMTDLLKPKKNERRFITRTRTMEPTALDNLLEGSIKTRSTVELAAKADDIIAADMDKAIDMAKTGTDDTAVAVASRLIDRFVTEAKAAKGAEAKDALWERVADIANDAAKNLTENGRAIQAATLLGKTTPEGMVRFASKTIQNHNAAVRKAQNPLERTLGGMVGTRAGNALKEVPELTPEQAKNVVEKMEDILQTTDPLEKAKKMQKLTDEIQAYLPSSLYKKISTVWKAGLLTGLKTTGLNIASNTSHFLSEIIKDVPASMVDRLASLVTGKRTLAMTTGGTGRGLAEGAKKGWTYWKTGFDERDIGTKLDYKKVNFGTGKIAKAIQAYEELVFKTIGAQDQPFYYATKMRSLTSQAIAQAKNQKLRGKEAKAFVEKLIENPTDDMLKYAVLDAETAVFQNKTTLGKAAKAIQDVPGGQFVLPFAKTPSAVATQIINYSPFGIAKTIIENVGKGKFDQRLFSQGMGRGITGTGAVAIGMALYKNDMLTLGFPSSEKEREQWELEGKLPNSIYINGQWRNVGVLGPAGLLTIIGGHFQNGLQETGSLMGGLVQSVAGFGNTLTEQSFLKGVNGAIEAIQDPARSFQGFASSLAGSIVPTIIGDIARATDDYERQASTPLTRIQSRIPGLRDNLQPKVDTLGNKIDTQGFWTVMMDPTRPGNASALPEDKPIVDELRRLSDAGFPTTPTQLGPTKGYESLTPEQNTYLWRLAGLAAKDVLKESMSSKIYSRLDDEEKSKFISDRIDDVKVEARARAILKFTTNMEGSKLNQALAKMKEDGLLTKQVFEKYQSLKRREN